MFEKGVGGRFVRLLLGAVATAGFVAGCGDGGQGPSDGDRVEPIGPIPAGLTGKVGFVTSKVVTSSSGASIESRIHVIDMADLTDRVIYIGRGMQVEDLTWAPDGEHLVIQNHISRPFGPNGENQDVLQLHSLDLAGTQDLVIFDGLGPELHPEYGRDGRLAYFARWNTDPAAGIHIGGTPILPLSYDANSYLAWVPNGDALVYSVSAGLQRLLLADKTVTLLVAAENGESITQPSISPDGGQLAFMRFAGNRDGQEIWVATPTGAEPRRLTSGSGDGSPVWTPNGTYIAFWRFAGAGTGIYVVPPAGGPPQRIVGVGSSGAGIMDWSQ